MTLVVLVMPGETERIVGFEGWRDQTFIFLFICTSFMGENSHYIARYITRSMTSHNGHILGMGPWHGPLVGPPGQSLHMTFFFAVLYAC